MVVVESDIKKRDEGGGVMVLACFFRVMVPAAIIAMI